MSAVTFRITDPKQLDTVAPSIREQIEGAMAEPVKVPKALQRPEEDAGKMLIAWVDLLHIEDPVLGRIRVGDYVAHIPNGLARNKTLGGIFKAQGLRAAWPDYLIALPRGRHHGGYLELKAEHHGAPTDEQLDVLYRLQRAGYKTMVAWGFDEAQGAILGYLQER